MEAKAIARHVRVTPRKARRMVDLIRGKKATDAITVSYTHLTLPTILLV